MSELMKIGIKINKAIEAVWGVELTLKELEIFENYINHQETITPLLNPNFILEHGFSAFDEGKKRIELLRPIIKLKEAGK